MFRDPYFESHRVQNPIWLNFSLRGMVFSIVSNFPGAGYQRPFQ